MPTLGWIKETVEDRQAEREPIPTPKPPSPVRCPECGATVEPGELAAHLSLRHPVARPLLVLAGHAAPSQLVLRETPSEEAIAVANCTAITLFSDGGEPIETDLDGLASALSAEQGHFVIELVNARASDSASVSAIYRINIRVADAAELGEVDREFADRLALDAVNLAAIRAFADACAPLATAADYTDALANYVTGVLAKDQDPATGVTIEFSAFKERFQKALWVLSEYPGRRLPRVVCAAVRMNINDFRRGLPRSGVESLDACAEFLTGLAKQESPVHRPVLPPGDAHAAACPVDRATYEILEIFSRLHDGVLSDQVLDRLRSCAEASTFSPYDRVKCRALLASRYLSIGDTRAAIEPLQALEHDPVFTAWATGALAESGRDG
jgi:hypothetical protein